MHLFQLDAFCCFRASFVFMTRYTLSLSQSRSDLEKERNGYLRYLDFILELTIVSNCLCAAPAQQIFVFIRPFRNYFPESVLTLPPDKCCHPPLYEDVPLSFFVLAVKKCTIQTGKSFSPRNLRESIFEENVYFIYIF